jgi:L,D-transpeptidase catalytic domain/Putative peptidoglycan binding domain
MGKDQAANAYGNGGNGGPGDPGRRTRSVTIAGRPVRVAVIGLAVALFVLIVGAVGVYAYDRAHKDEIAEGVTVAGVDVGGMDREQAARKLHRRLVAPLQQPVKVKLGSERYSLTAKRAKLHIDVDATIDEAIDASQAGGIPGRVFRYVTSGSVDDDIEPEVSYSARELGEFVDEVRAKIDRPPQDASISASGSSLNVVPAENGRELKAGKLRHSLEVVLDKGARNKLVKAHAVIRKPEVSTKEVAEEYPVYLTLERGAFTLRLWKDLELAESYTVAVGAVGFDTPEGEYNIQNKAVDPAWHVPYSDWTGSLAGTVVPGGSPENPLKERWLGIYDGAGIHGTDQTYSLGTAASHGCVRMSIPDVIELYDEVPVGTPIYIG